MSNTASATAAKSTLTSTSTSARRQPQDAKGKQPAVAATDSGSGSDSESSSTEEDEDDDDDDGFSDWASSMHGALRTASLFGSHPAPASTTPAAGQDGEGEGDDDDDGLVWLDTPAEAVEYDAKVYGWDQRAVVKELGLDDYQRIKLVNWIRKYKPAPNDASLRSLVRSHPLFTSHEDPNYAPGKDGEDWNAYLRPTMAGDGMLQISFDDSWSSDGEEVPAAVSAKDGAKSRIAVGESTSPSSQNAQLLAELARSRAQVEQLRAIVERQLGGEEQSPAGASSSKMAKTSRKDVDTYYFDSYAANDIHELMLKDTTRTVGYGRFILSRPQVFKDAIVLDVGCGTGILSMFAAQAGAKHVYAIEASGLAHKARENIRRNGLEQQITVIQAKVEDVTLPVNKVDVIVSEWMGYMLLFEGMLDSVIHARDRFLRSGGLMAPSQTRVVLAGLTGKRIHDEAFAFWDEVYGFDMSAMKPSRFEEAIVDIVDPEEIATTEQVIQSIDCHTATVASLDFVAPFSLAATTAGGPVRAFVSWFDTFFASTSAPQGQAPESVAVDLEYISDDALQRPVTSSGNNQDDTSKPLSFTTGPHGKPTHWKQVIVYLSQSIDLEQGQRIEGTFHLRKQKDNLRELAIEIHFKVVDAQGKELSPTRYEVFKVT